jgi:hypothetical protein
MEYPKIETLFERNETTHKVIEGKFRCPEFYIPGTWLVTEKIDGTNVRIELVQPDDSDPTPQVRIMGRTDVAQMPEFLLTYLQQTFTLDKVEAAFETGTRAILFGEGYGPKINNGGNYRKDTSFRLFDVVVFGSKSGEVWWLNHCDVIDIARKLGIDTVPVLAYSVPISDIVDAVRAKDNSRVAKWENDKNMPFEGVVARTDPLLLMRNRRRLIWKLKVKDF